MLDQANEKPENEQIAKPDRALNGSVETKADSNTTDDTGKYEIQMRQSMFANRHMIETTQGY